MEERFEPTVDHSRGDKLGLSVQETQSFEGSELSILKDMLERSKHLSNRMKSKADVTLEEKKALTLRIVDLQSIIELKDEKIIGLEREVDKYKKMNNALKKKVVELQETLNKEMADKKFQIEAISASYKSPIAMKQPGNLGLKLSPLVFNSSASEVDRVKQVKMDLESVYSPPNKSNSSRGSLRLKKTRL